MEVFEKRAHKEYLKTYRYHKLPSGKKSDGFIKQEERWKQYLFIHKNFCAFKNYNFIHWLRNEELPCFMEWWMASFIHAQVYDT